MKEGISCEVLRFLVNKYISFLDKVRTKILSVSMYCSCRAPQLKSLRLISCKSISKHGLNEGIRKFHMLEELELSLHSDAATTSSFFSLAETCNAAAEACPLLKRLRLNKYCFHWLSSIGDSEATEIGKMRGLQFLQLFGNSLGNVGLTTILRGCVRLESLDIRHCFNVKMNDEVRAECARLQMLRLPDDSVDDYDLSFGSPDGIPDFYRNVGSPDDDPDPTGNPGSDWYSR